MEVAVGPSLSPRLFERRVVLDRGPDLVVVQYLGNFAAREQFLQFLVRHPREPADHETVRVSNQDKASTHGREVQPAGGGAAFPVRPLVSDSGCLASSSTLPGREYLAMPGRPEHRQCILDHPGKV